MIDLRKIENRERFWTLPDRRMTMPFSLILGVGFILILTVLLDRNGRAAQSGGFGVQPVGLRVRPERRRDCVPRRG